MGRKKEKTVAEKYIYKTVNHGKPVWVVCTYDVCKKQQRRQFTNYKAAKAYLTSLLEGQKFDVADFARLPIERILDIRDALKVLPENKSLKEAVLKAYGNDTLASLDDFAEAYNKNRDAKGCKSRHTKNVKSHINAIKEHFGSFDNINESSIFAFLETKGKARGTLEKWFADCNDFLRFCIRKDAIKFNPLDRFTIDDFGRAKSEGHRAAITIDVAEAFIRHIETKYPQFLKYYTLALFSGIRVAEICRIQERYIDYKTKSISLPAEITKKNKSEYLDDFEPNLWAWLAVTKGNPIEKPYAKLSTSLFKKFSLPQNFARHSFATYHYSLYRDPKRTAAITHHSPQQLMDDYMDALVDKKIAKQFFEIMPSKTL